VSTWPVWVEVELAEAAATSRRLAGGDSAEGVDLAAEPAGVVGDGQPDAEDGPAPR
jgi:hypothetical protein